MTIFLSENCKKYFAKLLFIYVSLFYLLTNFSKNDKILLSVGFFTDGV